VAGATVALLAFADRGASVALYVQLGVGMLLYQFAIGATNDIADATDDAIVKPGKPIPSGRVTPRAARLVAAFCAFGGLVVTAPLPLFPWLIGIAGFALGMMYDLALKRTPLSWLPLSLALPLVPAWVFVAAGAWSSLLWWAFPAGILLGAAIHFANELPDIDSRGKSRGSAHIAGPRRAFAAAMGLFGGAVSLLAVVLAFEAPPQSAFVAVTGAAALLLGTRGARLFGRNGLFGVLAAATALVAAAFVSAV
jgi:4-hydroxybenzoate polyprenyltransferase